MYKTIYGKTVPLCFDCYSKNAKIKTLSHDTLANTVPTKFTETNFSTTTKVSSSTSYRQYATKAYGMAILFTCVFLVIELIFGFNYAFKGNHAKTVFFALTPLYLYSCFSLGYCLFDKTWIEDVLLSIIAHGCVRWPRLIISLSLNGLKTLILFKIITAAISFIIGLIFFVFGVLIATVLSMFVFPFYANRDGTSL